MSAGMKDAALGQASDTGGAIQEGRGALMGRGSPCGRGTEGTLEEGAGSSLGASSVNLHLGSADVTLGCL